ncbi:MFS transporter [Thalassospira sp.]|uniref:MFS transporter n=1 Tax=Thalassospira sp. TaxID=1912094 RepID=UPI000C6303CF|nr:MFS transporter [Thalassospira sp.]MBC06121.1 MFS transporter [Thalassospira sp.]
MTADQSAAGASSAPALLVIALATLLSLVVFTLPLTTIIAIGENFAISAGEQAWIMSGMPLGAAAGLLGAGALGDNYGYKRTFQGGLVVLFASSILGALAPDAFVLIVARVLQGIGCAAVTACGLGLIGRLYDSSHDKARAAAIWAASLGAGVAIGPIVAALLLPVGGWRSSHWMVVIATALLVMLGHQLLPGRPDKRAARPIDVPGSILLFIGMSCLLASLTELRLGAYVIVGILAVIGVMGTALFIRTELRSSNPILQLGLFKDAGFVGATVAAFASGAGILSLMTLTPVMLEQGIGFSPFKAALVLTAWSAMTAVAAFLTRYLPRSLTPGLLLSVSITGCLVGQLSLLFMAPDAGYVAVLPGLFVAGISNGVLNASLGHQAVHHVPVERSAMGSAANNTARYLGSSVGITIIAIVIANGAEHGGTAGLFEGWRQAIAITGGFTVLGLIALWIPMGRRRFMNRAH